MTVIPACIEASAAQVSQVAPDAVLAWQWQLPASALQLGTTPELLPSARQYALDHPCKQSHHRLLMPFLQVGNTVARYKLLLARSATPSHTANIADNCQVG